MSKINEQKFIEKVFLSAKELWGEKAFEMKEHIETIAGAMYRIREFELTSDIEPVNKMRHGK